MPQIFHPSANTLSRLTLFGMAVGPLVKLPVCGTRVLKRKSKRNAAEQAKCRDSSAITTATGFDTKKSMLRSFGTLSYSLEIRRV